MIKQVDRNITKVLTPKEEELFRALSYFSFCGPFSYATMKKLIPRNDFAPIFNALHKKGYVCRILNDPLNDFKIV